MTWWITSSSTTRPKGLRGANAISASAIGRSSPDRRAQRGTAPPGIDAAPVEPPSAIQARTKAEGSTLRARSAEFKSALAGDIRREVWPHLEAGRIRPVIDSTFPLEKAAAAHRRMESSKHIGKIVLEVK